MHVVPRTVHAGHTISITQWRWSKGSAPRLPGQACPARSSPGPLAGRAASVKMLVASQAPGLEKHMVTSHLRGTGGSAATDRKGLFQQGSLLTPGHGVLV